MSSLKGRVAVVTGGGSGIGRAISILFGSEKAMLIVADKDVISGNTTVEKIRSDSGEATFVQSDVSVSSDVKNLIDRCVGLYSKLDILVNNAGVEQIVCSVAETPEEVWEEIMRVNLKGVFLGMKYAIPHFLKRGGNIINIASTAGLVGQPYCAGYRRPARPPFPLCLYQRDGRPAAFTTDLVW